MLPELPCQSLVQLSQPQTQLTEANREQTQFAVVQEFIDLAKTERETHKLSSVSIKTNRDTVNN